MTRPTPNVEQWIALLNFRDQHGRKWREELSFAWMDGRDADMPHGSTLRQIRNTFGPSWLYDLKKAELDRQRARFTLALADRRDEVTADQEVLAAGLAAEDRQIWGNMHDEEKAPYLSRAAVLLLSLNAERRHRERGL